MVNGAGDPESVLKWVGEPLNTVTRSAEIVRSAWSPEKRRSVTSRPPVRRAESAIISPKPCDNGKCARWTSSCAELKPSSQARPPLTQVVVKSDGGLRDAGRPRRDEHDRGVIETRAAAGLGGRRQNIERRNALRAHCRGAQVWMGTPERAKLGAGILLLVARLEQEQSRSR